MTLDFKIYTHGGREYFVFDGIKKDSAYTQGLLDFLYLDIRKHAALFERMGKAVQALYPFDRREENKNIAIIRDGLYVLAKEHIYFELFRLNWDKRLDKLPSIADRVDILPHKEITHIPSDVQSVHEQIIRPLVDVLYILTPQKQDVQAKLEKHYKRIVEGTSRCPVTLAPSTATVCFRTAVKAARKSVRQSCTSPRSKATR